MSRIMLVTAGNKVSRLLGRDQGQRLLISLLADSQVPWGVEALDGKVSDPAWRHKPSWYMVTSEDRMIPPPLQRDTAKRTGSTVTEEAGSHSIYISQPHAVAELIKQTARLAQPATATV